MSVKNTEILRNQLFIIQNIPGIAGEHTAPGIEDHRAIGNVSANGILFDENDGLSFLLQASDGARDLSDDWQLQDLPRFVEQKHPRIAISARPIANI